MAQEEPGALRLPAWEQRKRRAAQGAAQPELGAEQVEKVEPVALARAEA